MALPKQTSIIRMLRSCLGSELLNVNNGSGLLCLSPSCIDFNFNLKKMYLPSAAAATTCSYLTLKSALVLQKRNFTTDRIDHNRSIAESSNCYSLKSLPNIVSQDDYIVAVNKPHGLSVHGTNSQESSDGQTLSLMLPSLSHHLGSEEELNIGLALKSYYSGLVLLTKNSIGTKKLEKSLSLAAAQKRTFLTYLAIVVGKPRCEMEQKKEMYLESQYLHNREMTVVANKSISSARKEGKMIQTIFSMRTISSNDRTYSSLVEIEISKDKIDAVPVLLSHYLSPVLGDNIYSRRTTHLMGVPIPSPPRVASPGPQRLPVSTENALSNGFQLASERLPLFLHRNKVTLPKFPDSSSSTKYTAPPSADFMEACKCLGLKVIISS